MKVDYEIRCQNIVSECKSLLMDQEWEDRYFQYADKIIKNKQRIQDARKSFHQVRPLYVYSRISEATKGGGVVEYDLRSKIKRLLFRQKIRMRKMKSFLNLISICFHLN